MLAENPVEEIVTDVEEAALTVSVAEEGWRTLRLTVCVSVSYSANTWLLIEAPSTIYYIQVDGT